MKKIITGLASFVGLVIIEGLSGGISDRLIIPLIDKASFWMLQLFDLFQSPFANNVLRMAAERHSQQWQESLKILIILVLFCLLVMLYFQVKDRYSWQRYNARVKPPFLTRLFQLHNQIMILIVFLAVVTWPTLFTRLIVNDVSNYLYKGIEIVRPNMPHSEYIEIRSKIMQIQNKKDFDEVSQQLEFFADDDHQLPEKPDI